MATREELKSYFETDDIPTQEQFWELIDSMAIVGEDNSGSVSAIIGQSWNNTQKALARANIGFDDALDDWIVTWDSIEAGALPLDRLPSVVGRKDQANTWALAQTFNGDVSIPNDGTYGGIAIRRASGRTGFLQMSKPDGTRQGYIGFDNGNDISFTNEQSGIFAFNKGATFNGNTRVNGNHLVKGDLDLYDTVQDGASWWKFSQVGVAAGGLQLYSQNTGRGVVFQPLGGMDIDSGTSNAVALRVKEVGETKFVVTSGGNVTAQAATFNGDIVQDVGAGSNTLYQLGTASSNVAYMAIGGGGSIARWADGHTYINGVSNPVGTQLVLFSSNVVAIGTNTTPTTKFHVEGTSSFSGASTFSGLLNIGSTDCRMFRDSGNLYIESDGTIIFRDTSSSAYNMSVANGVLRVGDTTGKPMIAPSYDGDLPNHFPCGLVVERSSTAIGLAWGMYQNGSTSWSSGWDYASVPRTALMTNFDGLRYIATAATTATPGTVLSSQPTTVFSVSPTGAISTNRSITLGADAAGGERLTFQGVTSTYRSIIENNYDSNRAFAITSGGYDVIKCTAEVYSSLTLAGTGTLNTIINGQTVSIPGTAFGFSNARFERPSTASAALKTYESSLSAWQEPWRGQASASGATIGFLGATPLVRQTLPAAATDAATTQTLANALRDLAINFGLAN